MFTWHTIVYQFSNLLRATSWTWNQGFNAKEHQVFYPIPQQQIDANPKLAQNDGY